MPPPGLPQSIQYALLIWKYPQESEFTSQWQPMGLHPDSTWSENNRIIHHEHTHRERERERERERDFGERLMLEFRFEF